MRALALRAEEITRPQILTVFSCDNGYVYASLALLASY